jgi:Fe-S oxidoreductase
MLRRLDAHTTALDLCTFCPKLCRFACPVADAVARESVTPWGLMTRVNIARRGEVPFDAETAAVWEHCTGCRRCQTFCKYDNDVPTAVYAARTESERAGLASPALGEWATAPRPESTAFGALPEGGDTVLLPGHASGEVVEAAVALLHAAGYSPLARPIRGVFQSGIRLVEAGRPDAFETEARRVARALDDARLVICLDPGDAQALRETFHGLGLSTAARVAHLTEALTGQLGPALAPAVEGDVLYLDACRLGRGLGVYEPPRTLLAHVVSGQVLEATMTREEGGCCGAGAGLAATWPDGAAEVARAAAADVPDVPVVTASPACAAHLRAALAPRPVLDWATVLADALDAGTGA